MPRGRRTNCCRALTTAGYRVVMVIVFTTKRREIHHIEYSFSSTPHGEMLTAWCGEWLCYATFTKYLTREVALQQMQRLFPRAKCSLTTRQFDPTTERPRRILLAGTRFRHDVWRALLKVPYGSTATYSALAAMAGHTRAVRAVATSVGCNPVSVVVPCHRILPTSGGTGNYHSGPSIKQSLLDKEASA